ncbi:palmitoyltransferase ZDHHC1 isoform X3 [Ochotona princeps]|uniref:palmitoyltransferase ZDHHC1 isoform X3 n=1 Tax=Ochotona princeps TaxID=9978 RepID=UPI0027144F0B|nr:palmitoyltransferase ZDHHC1 isoform X3 [Ochotona princeps]
MFSLLLPPPEMTICNRPSNKTAPEKGVWSAPTQASPELQGQRSRRNGWSWPPHPLQIVAWLLYLFFAVIGFGVLVPLLPHHWMPAGYACMGAIFVGHLLVHLTAVSIDPADANVRDKSYSGPLPIFNRSQHAHVIEDLHCNLCDVDVSARSKHCSACNKCVCGFDHHCKWLNNCVGERNYRASAILALTALLILLGLLSTALLGHLLCFHIYLMWHKLTTYEYIVRHRPPQESQEAHRELELCPPKMRPIQEMEFYTQTFSHARPEPPSQARPVAVNAKGQGEPPLPSSPDTLTLPPRICPQKKKKRCMYKVPMSEILNWEVASLPRLRGSWNTEHHSSSLSDSTRASQRPTVGPAGTDQLAWAESLDETPVAQTRLGSAALATPGGRAREPGLALQTRAPAVCVSPWSGELKAPDAQDSGLK